MQTPKLFLLLGSAALAAIPASAQTNQPAASKEAASSTGEVIHLDRVEVNEQQITAIASSGALGERSVLDTPFSISVVDRESLERHQPKTLGEAFFGDASVVSNVNSYASGWRERVKVRGSALNWNNYRLNGLPVETTTLEWPFELMEQVELFKGPNGFLYGFGVPGGMFNYRTKQPLPSAFTALTLGWYSDAAFTAGIDVSRRAGKDGRYGYRVNLGQELGELYNGGDINKFFGSVAFEARIRSDLRFTAEVLHIDRSHENEAPIVGYDYGNATVPVGSVPPPPINARDVRGLDGTFDDVTNTVVMTGLEYQIGPDWKTSAVYQFYRGTNDINKVWYSLVGTAGNYDIYDYQLSWDETDSHFVQSLTEGKFETGRFKHQVVGGVSFQNRRSYHTAYDWIKIGTGNLYTGNNAIAPYPPHSDESFLGQITDQLSVFASDTVEVLPGLSALVGLRYDDYRQETPAWRTTPFSLYESESVTPTYALIYKPAVSTTIYASYIEALERGSTVGANSGGKPYTNVGQVLDPLISEQTEIGVKYEGMRWGAGVAAFRFERGAHITRDNGDGTVTMVQDGINLYEGVELNASVKAAKDLTLSAGFIWMEATYEKLSTTSANLEGKRIAGSSEKQAVLQAIYNVPFLKGLEVHGGVRYFGDCYYNNTNAMLIPSYTLANAGFGYSTMVFAQPVVFRAEVNNLTDKEHWMSAGLGQPRTFAVSAKINW
ncbi:MAG: TonB-dependent receptor [Nibricoccus sp.]